MISTVTTSPLPAFARRRLVHVLIALYTLLWAVCAVAPLHRFDWLLENLLVFIAVPLLAHEIRTRPLSDLSYILIAVFLGMHTVGSHYTYAEVPLGTWLQDLLSMTRNHYDRVVHFGCGLLIVYPVREAFDRYAGMGAALSGFIAFMVIASASVIYEIIEMIVAAIVSPDSAMAFLGVQGDLFDAQKDSALAVFGALIGIMLSHRQFVPPR